MDGRSQTRQTRNFERWPLSDAREIGESRGMSRRVCSVCSQDESPSAMNDRQEPTTDSPREYDLGQRKRSQHLVNRWSRLLTGSDGGWSGVLAADRSLERSMTGTSILCPAVLTPSLTKSRRNELDNLDQNTAIISTKDLSNRRLRFPCSPVSMLRLTGVLTVSDLVGLAAVSSRTKIAR